MNFILKRFQIVDNKALQFDVLSDQDDWGEEKGPSLEKECQGNEHIVSFPQSKSKNEKENGEEG